MRTDSAGTNPRRRRLLSLLRTATAIGAWLVVFVTLGAWGAVRMGDVWWPGTVAMFSPRWVWLAPPAVAALASVAIRRRSLAPAGLALGLALGPVMGLCIPWRSAIQSQPPGPEMRVLTCNMHYGKTDPAQLDALLADAHPHVIALQEWRDSTRSTVLAGPGWHVRRDSGLCLASRFPIRRADRLGKDSTDERGSAMRYELDTPAGLVAVFSLHLASPRDGLGQLAGRDSAAVDSLAANTELRREQLTFLAGEAARERGSVLVVGDFNTPPESALMRKIWGGYTDAFGEAGLGWGYTFVVRTTRVRIDYILAGGGGRATRCWVGPDVGSPHRPVIADIAWPETAIDDSVVARR